MKAVKSQNIRSLSLTILSLLFSLTLTGQVEFKSSDSDSITDLSHLLINNSYSQFSLTGAKKSLDFDYNSNYHNSLGMFCKMENQISQSSNINFRMRLGNLQYVDALEMKIPSYRIPNVETHPDPR